MARAESVFYKNFQGHVLFSVRGYHILIDSCILYKSIYTYYMSFNIRDGILVYEYPLYSVKQF